MATLYLAQQTKLFFWETRRGSVPFFFCWPVIIVTRLSRLMCGSLFCIYTAAVNMNDKKKASNLAR